MKKSYAVVFHSDANLEDLADFKSDERLVHENTLFVRSSFFENNFPEIREIYDRVHNRDEITLIAEKLIKGLQEYELKCGDCPIF